MFSQLDCNLFLEIAELFRGRLDVFGIWTNGAFENNLKVDVNGFEMC